MKLQKNKANRKSIKLGAWSFGLSAIVIAAVILLNLLLGRLPASVTQLDISGTNLYQISDVTTNLLSGMDKHVELILLAEKDTVDERVLKFTQKYASLSDRLSYTYVDIAEDPTALETYDTSANTIIVRCQETGKQTVVFCAGFQGHSQAIISYDPNVYMQYQQLQELTFDGEGQLTAAVNYVTSDVTKTVYTLTGHGETDLNTSLSGMLQKANLTLAESPLNLPLAGSIPEDCDLLIIHSPTSDLTQDELDLLLDYLAGGGRMMLIVNSVDLANFNTLAETYGLAVQDGILGDYGRTYSMYSSQYGYFCIAPVLSTTNKITSSLSANAIAFYARGMLQVDPVRDSITVSPFLTTSEQGFLYLDQEHEPQQGTYLMGATATEETDGGTARLTVISAASLIGESVTSFYSSMSNLDIFMNAVTDNFDGEVSNTSIPAISLTVENITVPNPNLWAALFVIILPLATLVGGLVYWLKRRKR